MKRFYGFDLGDAESAVSLLERGKNVPDVLTVRGAQSFITAWARLTSGELLIGEEACYTPDAVERKLRFKSRYLKDAEARRDVQRFAAGVLGELYAGGDLAHDEESCFYVGCPAGWDRSVREGYRALFERAGYPPVRIISESRAALVSACRSRHLQVGYDILSHPVLVVDIGSSTTDFAYIAGGREVELQTGGEVSLGGGVMDEILLDEAVDASGHAREIRAVFDESEPWLSYCEFAARRLKEKYFSDPDYWKHNECAQTVRILYDRPLKLTLRMDEGVAQRMLTGRTPRLEGKSFKSVFMDGLKNMKGGIAGQQPDLIFMTGGVSRMSVIGDWCREVFPEAVVITELHPEFSVSSGLARCGLIDEELRLFTLEVEELKSSSVVEQIVQEHIGQLYTAAVDALTEPILQQAVLPVIRRWREGEIRRLEDVNDTLKQEITAWLHTDEARALLVKPVAAWLKPVAYKLEEHTVPICVRHGVPYRSFNLTSYLTLSDVNIQVDTRSVFEVERATWLIDMLVSVIVGLLCGGGGLALIAEGLPGVVAGAVISILVLLLGKDWLEGALMKVDIPVVMRKLIPMRRFEARIEKETDAIRENFRANLAEEGSDELTRRMVTEISEQIEDCLTKMAKVVEIPLIESTGSLSALGGKR